MCTAISYKTEDHYFGRNLDLEYAYSETVTITPRNYPFIFRMLPKIQTHYAMIGMATVSKDYPLYYEATNECGLSIAGLNFPGNAAYLSPAENQQNVAPYELIPWLLGQCRSIEHVKLLLEKTNLVNIPFSNEFPLSSLHWMIADENSAIVLEPMRTGIKIYDNPIGVLTNNPPFDYHMTNLSNYLNLTSNEPSNRFSPKSNLTPYSRGMGAIGLPGDLSSASRFVKAAFTKLNSVSDIGENASVSQFFHILAAVAQQRGCVKVNDAYEKTVYSCCSNTNKGIYYYTTYENSQITAIKLSAENLQGNKLITFPLITEQQIRYEN